MSFGTQEASSSSQCFNRRVSRPQLHYRPVSIGSVYLLLLCVPLKPVLFCLVNMLGGCTSHDSAAFVKSIDFPKFFLVDSMASMVSFLCPSSSPFRAMYR